jgi:hypothetical protein
MYGKNIWKWQKTFGTRYLSVKKRNHREDIRYSERTAWISIYAICRKGTDGDESRAYLCMHESEKTGKDSGKTRLEYSHFFIF